MTLPRCQSISPTRGIPCSLPEGHAGAHKGPYSKDDFCLWINTAEQKANRDWDPNEYTRPARPEGERE